MMKYLFSILLLAAGSAVHAQTLSVEEALRLAFPLPCEIERRTAYLDEAQLAEASRLAGKGVEVRQRVVTYYVARRNGALQGIAYFDAHRVRTLGEVVMVVVGVRNAIERVEILKFAEPPEYRASGKWLDQLDGKTLSPELSVKRGVPNMTGATLTSNAIVNATRRVLAIHSVIQPFGGKP